MKDKIHYYLANVYGYAAFGNIHFIVKAKDTNTAKDIVYKQVCNECPPEKQKAQGYEPYHKRDITVCRIDKLYYDENGIAEPGSF